MSESIHLKAGQLLELPVGPGHSLASHQSVQVPTHDELLAHPFYSRIISHLTDRARVNLAATEGVAATLSNEHKNAIVVSGVRIALGARDGDWALEPVCLR